MDTLSLGKHKQCSDHHLRYERHRGSHFSTWTSVSRLLHEQKSCGILGRSEWFRGKCCKRCLFLSTKNRCYFILAQNGYIEIITKFDNLPYSVQLRIKPAPFCAVLSEHFTENPISAVTFRLARNLLFCY